MKRPVTADLKFPAGRYIAPCLGELHTVILSPNGHIGFCNHPSIQSEVLLNKIGGACYCAHLFNVLTAKTRNSHEVMVWSGPDSLVGHDDPKLRAIMTQLVFDFLDRKEILIRSRNKKRNLFVISERFNTKHPRDKKFHLEMLAHLCAQRANILAKSIDVVVRNVTRVILSPLLDGITKVVINQDWLKIYKNNMSVVDGYFVLEIVKKVSPTRERALVLSNHKNLLTTRFVDVILESGGWHIQSGHKEMLDNRLKEWTA